MATFTIRISLDNGTVSDYQVLTNLLQEEAFELESTKYRAAKHPYKGQPTEVSFAKDGTIHSIVGNVLKAARKTTRQFSFTVIKKKR